MNNERLDQQITFMIEVERLKNILRRTSHVYDNGRENSAEHSWHVALAAIILMEYANQDIDVLRVIKMLLIHDIVEIEAGDVFLYDSVARQANEKSEKQAAHKMFGMLPVDQQTTYLALWQEFTAGTTPEAKFAPFCGNGCATWFIYKRCTKSTHT